MLKLHGVAISNYYNSVKAALLEKGIDFEEVSVFPSQKPEVLACSPMGKVPWLEVDGGCLSETNVIFDYLEEIRPTPALYPEDVFLRAKARELIRTVELYIDLPARRHIATVYFGQAIDQIAYEQARPALESGLRALESLARFGPYIAGDRFTYADITAYFQIGFANLHTKKIYDWDIAQAVPGLADYLAMIGERPSVAAADATMQQALQAFLPDN